MIKKFLMIFLPLVFIFGVLALVLFFQKKLPETSVSLPFMNDTPTPTMVASGSAAAVFSQLPGLNDDLTAIEQDLEKMRKEDTRLIPPSFIFNLGL